MDRMQEQRPRGRRLHHARRTAEFHSSLGCRRLNRLGWKRHDNCSATGNINPCIGVGASFKNLRRPVVALRPPCLSESQAIKELSKPVSIAFAEAGMSQHLTRARLYRSVIGAIFTMIVFATALFTSALHFAG
jgi:hypothetical protein